MIKHFLTCFLALTYGCAQPEHTIEDKQSEPTKERVEKTVYENFETGKILLEKCRDNPDYTYCLYLPESYSPQKKFPVIYCFDPHGKGSFPVEKYKSLAEKFGYILVGSDNSRNGMAWEQSLPIIQSLFSDIKSRIAIDEARIYTLGFSGGSRVASSAAIFSGGIKGVIGCGAAFPKTQEKIQNCFDFIGFAGNEDFNLNEMLYLDSALTNAKYRHFFIAFNGKHEWPSEDVMKDALLWTEFNAMKDELIPKNDSMIRLFVKENESKIKLLEKRNKNLEIISLYAKLISFLNGLSDTDKYLKIITSIDDQKETAHKKAIQEIENQLMQKYRQALASKNMNWWKAEITNLNKQSGDIEEHQMRKRILGWLSLVAYMNSSQNVNANSQNNARAALEFYKMVDPGNPEHAYFSAVLCAKNNSNDSAILFLKEAIQLKFDDLERMKSEASFTPLKSRNDFEELLQRIKKN